MEGKNSIILYVDTLEIVNDLTNEQAGILIKTISDYVSDKHPPDPEDPTIKIAWKIIRAHLKRDLKKWEESKEQKSISGKMGNLKRYHPDLYKAVKKNEIDLEKAQDIVSIRSSTPTKKEEPNLEDDVELPKTTPKTNVPKEKPGFDEERVQKATKVIADFFGILEVQQAKVYMDIGRFVVFLAKQGKIDWLSEQFTAYMQVKQIKGYKHSWYNFTGTIENQYEDGAWNKENWIAKLNETKKQDKKQEPVYKNPNKRGVKA